MPQPNVLRITTDQERWDAPGHCGNRFVKTPNLDALGARCADVLRSRTADGVRKDLAVRMLAMKIAKMGVIEAAVRQVGGLGP